MATKATERNASAANGLVLIVFIVVTILLNVIAISALFLGRRTRNLLLNGLNGRSGATHHSIYVLGK